MKPVMVLGIVLAGLVAGMPAWASQAQAKALGCLACHDATKKTVGPSIKDLAGRYKGQTGVVDAIVSRLRAGTGHPPAQASEAELKAIVVWMLK